MSQKVLLTSKEVHIILHRLACQLIENHLDFSNTVLIGLQPRGKYLAERIKQILESDYNISDIHLYEPEVLWYNSSQHSLSILCYV